MKAEEILDEMESIMVEAARVPFTNKRVIEEDDLARLMDDLRDSMPVEINDARRVIGDRQRILDEAQKEAQRIIDQAKAYVAKLTDENTITKQAQEQAAEVTRIAKEQAEQVTEQAQQTADKLRNDAIRYADDVFKHLETNLNALSDVVRQGRQSLKPDKK